MKISLGLMTSYEYGNVIGQSLDVIIQTNEYYIFVIKEEYFYHSRFLMKK